VKVSIVFEVEQIIDGKGSAVREAASIFRVEAYSEDAADEELEVSILPEMRRLLVGS
jgi:hypothetical protein